ncbi:hypothetical protein [Acuticoccus sp.]|uniref:hypothetical protein n=1 Tax=Acuticoccus sp. TaxID=1904378 RepID=UPI003B51EB8D
MIEVVAALSDPGRADKANEDGFGASGRFAWVIDGATGLGEDALLPAPSDAAWLTGVLDEALREGVEATSDPFDLLSAAAARAEARFLAERRRPPAVRYEVPTAAVLVARFGEVVDIVELGDCAVWIEADGATLRRGGTEEGRAREAANARSMMASGGGRNAEVVAFLRTVRNLANTDDGYSIFAPDADCTRRARRHRVEATSGEALFLTDGFEAAIDDYGLHTGATLLSAARDDLAGARDALRAVERTDPDCTRYPRFKPSDDATALLVRFG